MDVLCLWKLFLATGQFLSGDNSLDFKQFS